MEKTDIYPFKRIKSMHSKRFNLKDANLKVLGQLNWGNLFLIVGMFFLSRALVLGELIPFGLAFLTAGVYAKRKNFLPLLLGLVFGTLSAVGTVGVITTSLSAIIIFNLIHRVKTNIKYRNLVLAVIPSATVIVIKALSVAILSSSMYNYVAVLIEGLLVGILTIIFSAAFTAVIRRKDIKVFTVEELICIVILLVGLLMGMTEIKIGLISLKGTLSRLIILTGAYIGGVGIGAAVGSIIGLIPSISTMAPPSAMGSYAFAGLLAGGFKQFGKIGIGIGFILATVILSVFFTDYSSMAGILGESVLAVVVFLVIPKQQVEKIKAIIFTEGNESKSQINTESERRLRQVTSERIKEFALVFNELSKSFEHLSGEYAVKNDDKVREVFRQLTLKVCNDCTSYKVCWEKEFYKMYKDILDLFTAVELEGYITSQDIPSSLKKRCVRTKELTVTINCLYDTYKMDNFWRTKIEESREVVSGQLRGVSSIMNNLAQEIRVESLVKNDLELFLAKELLKHETQPHAVSVLEDSNGRLEVTLIWPACKNSMECMNTIAPMVSTILGQPMVVANPNCTKKAGQKICEYTLVPARKFEVIMGVAKAAKNNSVISGDSFATIHLKDGKLAMVLSDGMGVGPKAAMESRATVGLLEKLMETGFEKDLAVKTVNSVLVLRNPEDSFATVDLLVIDLYTGIGDFIKIASAPTFIKREEQVGVIKSTSLPVGILHNIDADTVTENLRSGDIIIMMTDGILDGMGEIINKEEWMCGEIQEMITDDPQKIADIILRKAKDYNQGTPVDDMTVLVAKIIDAH